METLLYDYTLSISLRWKANKFSFLNISSNLLEVIKIYAIKKYLCVSKTYKQTFHSFPTVVKRLFEAWDERKVKQKENFFSDKKQSEEEIEISFEGKILVN